jgi:hypothetical protein
LDLFWLQAVLREIFNNQETKEDKCFAQKPEIADFGADNGSRANFYRVFERELKPFVSACILIDGKSRRSRAMFYHDGRGGLERASSV